MQRSYRCYCSVRALETFVRDVAGLDIRQRRNNVSFRNLSTRSAALQMRHSSPLSRPSQAHGIASSVDDAFVPFETSTSTITTHDNTSKPSPSTHSNDILESPAPFDPNEEPISAEDFEPEIVIHEDQVHTIPDPIVREARIQQLDLRDRDNAIDAIFFPDLLAKPKKIKAGEIGSLSQRLNIFSAQTPMQQQYPGKNARKKARRAAQNAAQASEADMTVSEETTGDLETATTSSAKAASKARAKADRKAKRAALAFEVQTAILEQAARDQETADVASLIASATGPKPISKAKADKIALAIKTRKAEEKAAKKAAAEKLVQEQQAAKQAQKERNRNLDNWKVQKAALEDKFGEQNWNPRKRISPDALAGIRALHAKSPETFSTAVLAEHFKITPEAVRRILKSKWQPSEEEAEERRERWEKRGEKKWTEMAEQGLKPPKKWRDRGVGKAGPGEVPVWKQPGRVGERWIESTDADRFIMAGEQMADEEYEEYSEEESIASRIL
ncbi:hypothetical protein M436DRAFT_51628 [Aureobasidium namibiae CBS 147.97]|uniref:Required for respiratory growth protein 9, mitochondrial n=1 Tax=Aureobasidium namibiae CBS 147.97 TaxID=1043004 RepID=A0A074WDW3_9PEZI|nr:uncharacterized protein M436DRAFT_51628 [Aureobasidium namibiae CBS 147.97]KEQ71300.1 hypothetical protein M436DRAFT_51628 [Aureobasidium namibiae CBS 147.97]